MKDTRTFAQRFWSKIKLAEGDECYEWQAAMNNVTGYGQVAVGRKPMTAPRVAYMLTCGPIPKGMCICHKCDNRKCCRPDHLFMGTYSDNMKDMHDKKRGNKRIITLTSELIDEAKGLRKQGVTYTDIGLELGVNYSTIREAILGSTWNK